MGYIKEPQGVDLTIAPSILTGDDSNMIHEAIVNYKKAHQDQALTGEGISLPVSEVKKAFRNYKKRNTRHSKA